MPNIVREVSAIDMKQVDGAICNLFGRLRKGHLHQLREGSVLLVVMCLESLEDLGSVVSGMLIALPSIDCVRVGGLDV